MSLRKWQLIFFQNQNDMDGWMQIDYPTTLRHQLSDGLAVPNDL